MAPKAAAAARKRPTETKDGSNPSTRGGAETDDLMINGGDASVSELRPKLSSVRVNVNLPEGMFEALKERADAEAKTFTQALKEAVALKLFIADLLDEGGTKIIVEQPGRRDRELVFHY